MRRMGKRLGACLLALVLLCAPMGAVRAQAAGGLTADRLAAGETAAAELYELGLFKGTGTLPDGSPNFNLEGTATRGEAVTMLVRLLGGERDALVIQYCHPFWDAGWADDYVGYAYYTGISTGTSETTFGTATAIDCAQFLTLVLRALGYTEVNWRDPYPTADAAGLKYPAGEGFYRADIAAICLSALDCTVKGSGVSLRTRLAQEGVFDQSGGTPSSGFTAGPVTAAVTEVTVNSTAELASRLVAAMWGRAAEIVLHVPKGQEEAFSTRLGKDMEALTDANWINLSWSPGSGTMRVSLTYNDAAKAMAYLEGKLDTLSAEELQTLNEAKRIHAALVDPSMSEYEQVKAFHDYLVNNTAYKETGDRSHGAAGPLVDGYAVCDGYSKAFDLLCYLSGIDCIRVSGTSTNSSGSSGGHAWNKVKVDGTWYNVDVTWDDPVSSRPILRYDYFLVSDSTLARNHQWTAYSYLPAAERDYGK